MEIMRNRLRERQKASRCGGNAVRSGNIETDFLEMNVWVNTSAPTASAAKLTSY